MPLGLLEGVRLLSRARLEGLGVAAGEGLLTPLVDMVARRRTFAEVEAFLQPFLHKAAFTFTWWLHDTALHLASRSHLLTSGQVSCPFCLVSPCEGGKLFLIFCRSFTRFPRVLERASPPSWYTWG